jgi:hypothetical protein
VLQEAMVMGNLLSMVGVVLGQQGGLGAWISRWSINSIYGEEVMFKKIAIWSVVAIVFGIVLYVSIYFYGTQSESFKFVETTIRQSPVIAAAVGDVESVSLDPWGDYNENFVDSDKWVHMSVNVTGKRGDAVVTVSAKKINDIWSVDEMGVGGKDVFPEKAGRD